MGVNRTDYLMLGVDIGPEAFERDEFEAEKDGAPGRPLCDAAKVVGLVEALTSVRNWLDVQHKKTPPAAEITAQIVAINTALMEISMNENSVREPTSQG